MTPGRPEKQAAILTPEEITRRQHYLLAMVACLSYHSLRMPNLQHTVLLLRKRLEHQVTRSEKLGEEMGEVLPAYNRCLDLMRESEQAQNELNDLIALTGKEMLEDFKRKHEYDTEWNELLSRDPQSMRENLPLWKALRQYLHVIEGGGRVPEIMEFLKAVKIPGVNRQAIESAIKRHPQVFETKKIGREKRIFLRRKGA